MKYDCVENAVSALKDLESTMAAYNHVMGVLYHDGATVAPKAAAKGRGETTGVLSGITYQLIADPKNGELLSYLEENRDQLDRQTYRELELARKQYDQLFRIPKEEYVAFNVLVNDAQDAWEDAKNNNDFGLFAPYLEKIVSYNRKFAGYYNPEMSPYDALLNEYEEGLTTEVLDQFFHKLRETIVPLVAAIQKAERINDSFLYKHYPIDKQREFSDYLMQVLQIDRDCCGIAESEHPYTINFNPCDVRITTHYYENALASSMYSVIHEGGHAIYELSCDPRYNNTFLSGGVSMGIHESQSRFFENLIGRSQSFITYIFPKLQELFPEQLKDITAQDFYRAVNKAEPSLIRTEADELTYCLHIMVRYELEKKLIDGSLQVADLPAEWNRLYREYLGVDVPDDTRGCLQDSHWSGGSIGYFPSYALGSAYGPQIYKQMEKQIGNVDALLAKGDLVPVKNWLREQIHQHASFYKSNDLFSRVCGTFDPSHYTEYLEKKYKEIYNISW